jgi:pre-mRNA-splicing factor SPF27
MEANLAMVKAQTEHINRARKAAQEQAKGELVGLEENWKRGIGQILEIQVATDELRLLILEQQRLAANSAP